MASKARLAAALTACFITVSVPAAKAAESDVNGDGYSDLVTLRANGVGYVYGGGAGGAENSFLRFDSGKQGTFSLDPAQFDGTGHFVIDVTDVNADGRADQVTLSDDGKIHTYLGQSDKTFAAGANNAGVVSSLGLRPSLLPSGQFADESHEPVAVARVNDDAYADLVVADARRTIPEGFTGRIMLYPGNAQGGFEAGQVARSKVHVATNSSKGGEHFLDVADVTGDGRGDLVSFATWDDIWVRPGKADGTFDDPVGSGPVDNPMGDGVGYEPAGVADVTGGGRADLILLKDGRVYTYPGQEGGGFGSPQVSFSGEIQSTTFKGGSLEIVGAMDVNKDTRADLVAIGTDGNVYALGGQTSGAFSGTAFSFGGTFKSTQHFKNQDANGNEAVFEKPAARRRGCDPNGCGQQLLSTALRRVFGNENANVDIDGIDDHRVDADIAISDGGIDLDHPDLNVVDGLDCNNASAANGYTCESDSPDDGDGGDPTVLGGTHGTDAALGAAALDNDIGGAGVAPGARIWSLKVGFPDDYEKYEEGQTLVANLDAKLAVIKWAASNDIEVLQIGLPGGCTEEREKLECPGGPEGAKSKAIVAAATEAADAGVTIVASTGNWNEDVSDWPTESAKGKDYLFISSIVDSDGRPGGLGPPADTCGVGDVLVGGNGTGPDDSRNPGSGWGEGIDIAGPGGCGSATMPQASGAAALLASALDPDSRADVDTLRETIVDAGNSNWTETTGGPEGKGDGIHEPLLDVHDEEIFNPVLSAGCERPGVPEVDSDVDGDGRSDLVTLRPDGRVFVHGGNSSAQFETGVESFDSSSPGSPPLTPAQYVGEGHYVVDVADVTADGCADLITHNSDGSAYVYQGRPDRTFGHGAASLDGDLKPALLHPGGFEPIAAADVNGDGHADLITFHDQPRNVMVHLGNVDATFDEGKVADDDVFSALHTAAGEYFVDAADVTKDGRADLVSMTTWDDIWVRPGKGDGTFAGPVGSSGHTLGAIDTSMDDGVGREPVGVADVNKDGFADLIAHEAGTSYVYPATSSGTLGRFNSPSSSFSGGLSSTTFGAASGYELAGVLDVDGNGHSDLVTAHTNGTVYVAKGQASGVWGAVASSFSGSFKSTQHFKSQDASGSEIASEKPAARRRGCRSVGCHPPTQPSVASGFGAASRGGGVDLFLSDSAGNVAQRWWSTGTGWSSLGGHGSPPGGVATTEPGAVASSSEAIHTFVRGADGALWQKTWTDGSGNWTSWTSQGAPPSSQLATGPGPVAVSPTSGAMQVFARKSDNSVWRKRWAAATGWTSWEAVPSTTATGIGVATSGGGVDLYMRDASGNVTQRWWTAAAGWSGLGGHGSPQGLPVTSAPAAVSPTSSTVHVFVRGADQALWQKTWTGSEWTAWSSLGGVLRSGPTAVSPASGEIHVFARGANDSVWRKRWSTAGGWSGWEPVY